MEPRGPRARMAGMSARDRAGWHGARRWPAIRPWDRLIRSLIVFIARGHRDGAVAICFGDFVCGGCAGWCDGRREPGAGAVGRRAQGAPRTSARSTMPASTRSHSAARAVLPKPSSTAWRGHTEYTMAINNLAQLSQGHQPLRRGRAADAARTRHRREELRAGPSQRRQRPQQPGPVAPGHQPPGRGRAADAARLAIDEKSFGAEHPEVAIASTTWLSCSRTRTGWRRPSR